MKKLYEKNREQSGPAGITLQPVVGGERKNLKD